MWISQAYEREYRDWIASGQFDRLIGREREYLSEALDEEHPALIATSLSIIATCYHTRGAVSLLEKHNSGWRDIQAGYWADLYALRFEIIAITLPAWSQGRTFNSSAELVVALAFSRLFEQTEDEVWLEQAIDQYFDSGPHVANSQPGSLLLSAMKNTAIHYPFDDLLRDRRACSLTRDSYPKRPTDITPVGVIDLETIIHYPAQAAFQYPREGFQPTEDNQITDSIAAYHASYP